MHPTRASLGLWDAVSIIVGIVVGTAIFRSPTLVFQNVAGPWQALGAWLFGGFLCLVGALCYAELATAYPRNGGDYEYLGRAYGRWMGFLFGWAQLAVVLTSSIGMMAYVFADYSARLWNLSPAATAWAAAAAVGMLSAINLLGAVVGKTMQNVLSVAKVLGLLGIVLVGIAHGQVAQLHHAQDAPRLMGPGLGLAMVFVLYAFGGWNDAVFVAAEVRNQHRNLPRALFFGIAAITAVYLAVNASYLAVLGFEAARVAATPATDVMLAAVGPWGAKAVSLLVMVSALGAINGMIFAGSRVYAVVGEDHRAFALLGRWNRKTAVPVAAIVAQATIAMAYVFAVGTSPGRWAIDRALAAVGLRGLPWDDYFGGFETLLAATAPVFWTFFLLTGLAVFVLRRKDGGRQRPFRIPFYPLPPLIFCATCGYMLYSSLIYAKALALLGAVPLLLGLPIYWISQSAIPTSPDRP
jgi:amino acid transporter